MDTGLQNVCCRCSFFLFFLRHENESEFDLFV